MKKIGLLLIASLFLLVSCGGKSQDIINPDAEYRYFFGATCPHCQELNRLLDSADVYSQISIEKREIYHNNENREMFLELLEELDAERDGVPFVYDTVTGEVAVGVGPAFKLLTSRINKNPDNDPNNNKYPKGETILNSQADFVFFYGDDDPDSLAFLNSLSHTQKSALEIREVYSHKENGQYFMSLMEAEAINTSKLNVPFVFHRPSKKFAQGKEEILSILTDLEAYNTDQSFYLTQEEIENQ